MARFRAKGTSVLENLRSAAVGSRKSMSFTPRGIFLPSAFAFATMAATRALRCEAVPGFAGGEFFTCYIVASGGRAGQTLQAPLPSRNFATLTQSETFDRGSRGSRRMKKEAPRNLSHPCHPRNPRLELFRRLWQVAITIDLKTPDAVFLALRHDHKLSLTDVRLTFVAE